VPETADIAELQKRIAFLGAQGLLSFGLSPQSKEDKKALAFKIGRLDKRAHRELTFGSPEWEAVIQLLVNAISVGVLNDEVPEGEGLLAEAQKTFDFYRTLPVRNRLLYLGGVIAGIAAVTLLGYWPGYLLDSSLPGPGLVFGCLLAGIGSLASVLARLASIEELRVEHSGIALLISGASRPLVAAIVAVGIGLTIGLGLVTINVGEKSSPEKLFLLASFLCGFSERFGQEILEKAAAAIGTQKTQKKTAASQTPVAGPPATSS
jgi:hypothetical protein